MATVILEIQIGKSEDVFYKPTKKKPYDVLSKFQIIENNKEVERLNFPLLNWPWPLGTEPNHAPLYTSILEDHFSLKEFNLLFARPNDSYLNVTAEESTQIFRPGFIIKGSVDLVAVQGTERKEVPEIREKVIGKKRGKRVEEREELAIVAASYKLRLKDPPLPDFGSTPLFGCELKRDGRREPTEGPPSKKRHVDPSSPCDELSSSTSSSSNPTSNTSSVSGSPTSLPKRYELSCGQRFFFLSLYFSVSYSFHIARNVACNLSL